ncbi:MAG: hypothetical protein ABIJ83_03460 [Patescibacteria group bacterium]
MATNFSSVHDRKINKIFVYKTKKEIRPISISNMLLMSTCNIQMTNNGFKAVFSNEPASVLAIPYFYSEQNIITIDNNHIENVQAGLDNLNNSYTIVQNDKNSNTIFVEDHIYPFSKIIKFFNL